MFMVLRIHTPFTYAIGRWSNFSLETSHIISELTTGSNYFFPLPTLATELLSLNDEDKSFTCEVFKHYSM